MGGGHIAIKRRKNDWEGGFVKRRLKFVFITGAWSLSTFLLISWRYSVWFDLFVFATLKFVELRKNIQKRWWLESLNWKSKQHPLNSTWKKAHLGYYKWQTFSAQYFNMDKSDQITSQWITLLDSLTLSYWIVGPDHQMKNKSTTRNFCVSVTSLINSVTALQAHEIILF